jgi:hypothetical protein
MTIPAFNLNLIPTFPAVVTGSGPVVITKAGLTYTFGWDITTYSQNPAPGATAQYLAYDPGTGATELVPAAAVAADWNNIVNKPSTFPPTLPIAISGVSGLQSALDAKLDDSQATTFGLSLLGAANASAARTALVLVPGTDVQAFSSKLLTLAGQTWAADTATYYTSASAASTYTLTAAGRSMAGAASAAAQTALLSNLVGDSGSGGTKGLVPAPAAGDAAAKKVLQADGTWSVPIFSKGYDSGDQTITAAGLLTLPHGLGVAPKTIDAFLKCATADVGYSPGDVLHDSGSSNFDGTNSRGVGIYSDATNVYVRFGSATNTFGIIHKTTGALGGITNANWRYIVRAFA